MGRSADFRERKWKRRFAARLGGQLNLEGLNAKKDFAYAKEWNGKSYLTKRVRPVFVEEPSEIVVVTVYTYYF